MYTSLLFFLTLNLSKMEAQTTVSSPVGDYYLRGVMETACGFKLNTDSSFEFFFSYGALDRWGAGRWRVANNAIVFNSSTKPERDFALLKSSAGEKDKITLQLKEENEMLRRYVHCKIKGGGKEQEGTMNKEGFVEFALQPVETIELIFELCAEKKSVLILTANEEHHFEFRAEPWLMEVYFQNFRLMLIKDGLTGGHPLSDKTTFSYEKSKH